MKYNEKYTGNKEDFFLFLKDEVVKLFKNNLKIDGNKINLPDNEDLEYQIKFDDEGTYGDFSIKVKWGEKPEQPEELEENFNENSEDKPFEF